MIFERQIVKIQILRTKYKKNSNSDKMSKFENCDKISKTLILIKMLKTQSSDYINVSMLLFKQSFKF